MFNKIKQAFIDEGINQIGYISFNDMTIINPHLFPENSEIKSCIVFLVPYKTDDAVMDNYGVSLYARAKDYHIYVNNLYKRIIPIFENIFKGEGFFGFCDHSPINEKLAAAKAGLGVIGKNTLLINKKYGSFVFIGSLLTTLSLPTRELSINTCTNCSLCIDSCPTSAIKSDGIVRANCLSHISQKKNKNTEEIILLKSTKTVWGCDICQNICPLNKNKELTNIKYFCTDRLNCISLELIESMSTEIFMSFPFSWHGKNIFLENIINTQET